MKPIFWHALCIVTLAFPPGASAALTLTNDVATSGGFPLVVNQRAATIVTDEADAEVVGISAGMLAEDIERVTGVKPSVKTDGSTAPFVVLLGTIGKNARLKELIDQGKIDIHSIAGKWESFIIQNVADPFPGVKSALVIAGSDRRGAAYGAVTVAETIGVSPWVWWADVVPQHRANLVLSGTETQGPPSVKFRGIFINDEDWGLQPWAAKTFEPETNDIGPKTYAKVCELLLRLKANLLWPGMHPSTRAFNFYPENKFVADRYAIVMGSSHCEQMLRNNVDEWPKADVEKWDPVTNLPAITNYWEQRVRENGKFENAYTMGMRGIHDSGMPGGGTMGEMRDRLEKIINIQRGLLAKHVNPDPSKVLQIFCPYKEVLSIYQAGVKLPEDITLVWPDDNFGYIRQLSNVEERKRAGGSGVYYHLSYWGIPHDYLWLDSTSPALIWEEMTKAYELGARTVWVVNVGDIKPIETGMTLFLDLARNIDRYGPDVQRKFLRDFYTSQFGEKYADRIATVRDEYYRLCAIRKPEHMGFNRENPQKPAQNSDWSADEVQQILERWQAVAKEAAAIATELPADQRDSYFQLVEYSLCAAAAHVEKLLFAEKARLTGKAEFVQRAETAYQRVQQLTEQYNNLCNGKWRYMMDAHPRKRKVFDLPPTTAKATPPPVLPKSASTGSIVIDAAKFARVEDRNNAGWRVIEGLGTRGAAIVVLPHQDTPMMESVAEIRSQSPMVEYSIQIAHADEVEVTIEAMPTHSFTPGRRMIAAVAIGSSEPMLVSFDQGQDNEHNETWRKNVLRGLMTGTAKLKVPTGAATLKLWAGDPSLVVQRITLLNTGAK